MDQTENIQAQLDQARQQGHFVFTPASVLPPSNGILVPRLETIHLEGVGFTGAPFYKASGGFALHHQALMRLGQAAYISWETDPRLVGRTDNGSNPDACSFKAIGYYRTGGGLPTPVPAHKYIDLTTSGKAVKPKERQYICEKCETGAQGRVIKKVLGLPGNFKAPAQTFCIVGITENPYNPVLQKAQEDSFLLANMNIFGTVPQLQAPTPPIRDVTPPLATPQPDPKPTQNTKPGIDTTDFENIPVEEQVKEIKNLIRKKGYPHAKSDFEKYGHPADWTQEGRNEYLILLKNYKGAA